MLPTVTPALPVAERTANWLAVAAVMLTPFGVFHPLLAATVGVLAALTIWVAAKHNAWAAMRVAILVAAVLALSLLAVPFPIWFAVLALWALSYRFAQLRPEDGWLPAGTISKATTWFTVVIVLTAGLALTLWATSVDEFGEATTETAEAVGDVPILLLIVGAIVFALINAITEEIAYRLVVFDAALTIMPAITALAIQAVAFGLLHIKGFPAGVVGVALATVYGLSLGVLRMMSKGMRAPLIAHIAADATIAVLFFLVVVPAVD